MRDFFYFDENDNRKLSIQSITGAGVGLTQLRRNFSCHFVLGGLGDQHVVAEVDHPQVVFLPQDGDLFRIVV